MTALEVGKQLVELCKQGKDDVAVDTLYANDIVAIEAGAPPGQSPEARGIDAIRGKIKWWNDNHTIHSAQVDGPYPNGDQFICKFTYDITFKPENKRFTMQEMALYTVKDGKIVREVFFYKMG